MDAPAADLDPEQNIKLGQPDRVQREEVDRQGLVGVLADELAPGAVAATGCWRRLMAVEYSADGQVGAPVAELEELAAGFE